MGNILTAKAIEYKGKRKRNTQCEVRFVLPWCTGSPVYLERLVAAAGGPSVPVIWSHEGDWLVMAFFFFLSLFPEGLCPVITTSSSLDCPLQALLLRGN